MLMRLLMNLFASGIVLKRNLDWHRRFIAISIPIFIIAMLIQSEYTVRRIKKNTSSQQRLLES